MRSIRVALISACALALAGCSLFGEKEKPPASVDGACKSAPKPAFAYRGKAREDQRYIDRSIAFGVHVCKFPPPQPRPAAWDGPTHSVAGKKIPVPVPHKATFRERFGKWTAR
jgi:hypothetical protein